jgi:hypothetical protein
MRFCSISVHEERETGAGSGVAHARQLPLARVGVIDSG